MSIAFERITGNRIETSGLRHGISCGSAYEPPESVAAARFSGNRCMTAEPEAAVEVREEAADSSSSSSIGRNSNSDSDGDGDSGGGEVQSEYKGPLDCLDALEEVLPVKRGMSRFYNGKSKSFTNLADAVTYSSIKEIGKPENAFTRKRKNLIAHSTFWDNKNRNFPPRNNTGSTSKRPANSNRSFPVSSNQGNNNTNASSPIFTRPPLHPQSRRLSNNDSSSPPPRWNFPPWRSLSLSDLQGAVVSTPTTAATVIEGK